MGEALADVKSWMNFFGWNEGGGPGSVKRDANSQVIAHHGDPTWISDVETCIERIERERIIAEIERRDRLRSCQ